MPKRNASKTNLSDGKSQADKFRDLARALDCDEDEAAFKAKLRKIAAAPRPPGKQPSE